MNRPATSGLNPIQLMAYSLGGLAMNMSNLVLSQWLYERYVAGHILGAGLFSLILLAGRCTDGISDPFIAFWTDNAWTRWGRRLPFIVLATLPFAVFAFLLWTPPTGGNELIRLIYTAVVTQGYFLGYGLVVTPYLALLPEIAGSSQQRLNLTTGQAIGTLLGTLEFAFCGLVISQFGYIGIGLMVAAAILISFYPLTLVIRERTTIAHERTSLGQLFRWLAEVALNRDFRPLLAATSLFWFGLNLLLMLVPRWVDARLGLEQGAVTALMLPFILVSFAGFFLFNVLAKRLGKWLCYLLACGGSGLVFLLFGVSDHVPGVAPFTAAQIMIGLAGLPVAGFSVLPFALLSDVIDRDTARRGSPREAIFFGVQAIFQKSMVGLSVVVFAKCQELFGVESLRYIAVLAGGACVLALLVFLAYPLKREGAPIIVAGAPA